MSAAPYGLDGYMALVRRRRLYGTVLLVLFCALMASGFRLADARNAGGFVGGLHQIFDFPAEVLREGWAKAANLPALVWQFLPSLIETLNIAAVATIFGGIAASLMALMATRGLAPARWTVWPIRRAMDAMRAVPEIVVALVLIYMLGGGPVPAMLAITLHTAGALGKLFSEVAENADAKPVEGLASVGAGWVQRMWLGVHAAGGAELAELCAAALRDQHPRLAPSSASSARAASVMT